MFPLPRFHQLNQLKSLQAALEEDTKLRLVTSMESKWDRWNTSTALQTTARSQRIEEKRYQEEKRKRQRERRLIELERERVENVCVVSQHRRHLEGKAEKNREARAHNESMVGMFVWLYWSVHARLSTVSTTLFNGHLCITARHTQVYKLTVCAKMLFPKGGRYRGFHCIYCTMRYNYTLLLLSFLV